MMLLGLENDLLNYGYPLKSCTKDKYKEFYLLCSNNNCFVSSMVDIKKRVISHHRIFET